MYNRPSAPPSLTGHKISFCATQRAWGIWFVSDQYRCEWSSQFNYAANRWRGQAIISKKGDICCNSEKRVGTSNPWCGVRHSLSKRDTKLIQNFRMRTVLSPWTIQEVCGAHPGARVGRAPRRVGLSDTPWTVGHWPAPSLAPGRRARQVRLWYVIYPVVSEQPSTTTLHLLQHGIHFEDTNIPASFLPQRIEQRTSCLSASTAAGKLSRMTFRSYLSLFKI